MGLPRSGKTTWAQQQTFPIVNPDSIRYALHGQRYQAIAEPFVWAIAMVMVRALFLAGHDTVIVDATHNTRKRRDFWRCDEWDLCLKHFPTSKEICIERAKAIQDDVIIPIIEKMANEADGTQPDEVFEIID